MLNNIQNRNAVICDKCEKVFKSANNLKKHKNKKIQCDRVLKCPKCNVVSKNISNFRKHLDRKTSCELIQGDPTKPANDKTCHFCYKEYKTIYTLKRHFKTCKIKNGNTKLLFEKIDKIEKKLSDMEKEKNYFRKNASPQTINNYNCNNKTFNFNIINFGDIKSVKLIRDILSNKLPEILTRDFKDGSPQNDQINDRISEIVKLAHRNPEHKGLQNVYVDKPNAYIYDSKWIADNWDTIQKSLLASICNTNMLDFNTSNEPRDPHKIGNIMQRHAKTHSGKVTKKESEELSEKLASGLSLESIYK